MDRSLLPHFPAILAVARRRSFAAAAAELGMGASAVSHAVKTLEDRLGVVLFTRTTRSVALTEAGSEIVEALGRAFSEVEEVLEHVRSERGQVTGLLRINAPRVALPIAITPILKELARRHPDLTVEVACDDALTDIVGAGFDAGVRLGEMIAQDMIAVRLTPPFKAIIVATPDYLAAFGTPRSVKDLERHNCIGFRLLTSRGIYDWELQENGKDISVGVRGTALITDPTYARELALAGIGVAYVFEPLVQDDLRANRLCWVLPDTAIEEPGLFIYYPPRAGQAPKLRAFLDVAKEISRRPGT